MRISYSPYKFEQIIQETNRLYLDLLGYSPEKTKLEQTDLKTLQQILRSSELDQMHLGIYFPRNQTALIPQGNLLSLFHEFYGHGLFCEQTQKGKQLVNLERQLLEEEKQSFQKRQFSSKDLENFREQSKTFKELKELERERLEECELFAIWTEYFLAREHKVEEIFEQKYKGLSEENRRSLEKIISFSKKFGEISTFYELGLARQPTIPRIKRLLRQIYGNEVEKSKLVIMSGSRKPFSDIDLFASSQSLGNIKNEWIDLVSFQEQDFEKRVSLFEVQVTHPIEAGELVFGENDYLLSLRKRLQTQPITEEAIKHNLTRAEANKDFASITENLEHKKIALSYYHSYLANAIALRNGLRLLTKESLLRYLQEAPVVSDEKRLQLEGGNIK